MASAALYRILASGRIDVALIQEPWLVKGQVEASGKPKASKSMIYNQGMPDLAYLSRMDNML
jgi:hypothetical protein